MLVKVMAVAFELFSVEIASALQLCFEDQVLLVLPDLVQVVESRCHLLF